MARWVRTSVEMFDHPILDKGPFDRRSAWLWLIANAAWKPRRVSHKGKPVALNRGQMLIGRAYLAEKWGWSEQNVRTFLSQLVAENMLKINQSTGHFANVATVCNYDKYQTTQPVSNQSVNQCSTSVQPEPNQTLTNTTNTTTSSVVLSVAARAEPSAAATLPDRFMERLVEAAGDCLANPVNAQGLLTEATPLMWLESGCDLERDILPTLRAASKSRKGKRISTWGYFTDMIAENRARRLAGMPAPALLRPTAAASYTPKPFKRSELSEAEKERIAMEYL